MLPAATATHAAVIVTAPMTGDAGTLAITAPVSFTLSTDITAGSSFVFVFQNWVTASDGTANSSSTLPRLAFTINGSPALYGGGGGSAVFDNAAATFGSLAPTDGYIVVTLVANSAVSGGSVTLSTGTYALAAPANFNPQATQAFTGNAFIADFNGTRISNIVSAGIPEPSTWALCLTAGAGLLGLGARQRRGARG